jgi:hypothetical protein
MELWTNEGWYTEPKPRAAKNMGMVGRHCQPCQTTAIPLRSTEHYARRCTMGQAL